MGVLGRHYSTCSLLSPAELLPPYLGAPHSLVRTRVLKDVTQRAMQGEVRSHVEPGANLFTDRHWGYYGLSADYMHEIIDHVHEYVRGRIHTNGIENFWSLLKRAIHGTYVSIEPFHVTRYLDEQTFRFNTRAANDGQRFRTLVKDIVGKHLTYSELTGTDRRQFA